MKNIFHYSILVFLIIFCVSLTIHPFEVPDENAHFSSLNFLSNEGRMPTKYDKDNLSKETYQVENFFGIVAGENKYSYNPDYRIEQVAGTVGKYEDEIKSLGTAENRTIYEDHRAALYPPLYYRLTLPFHNLVSDNDILLRIFVSRISSVLFTTLVVLSAFWIGRYFSGNSSFAYALAGIALFYPMTTYIGSGINSDNLHNLLFALATLMCLKIIKEGFVSKHSLILGALIGLDLITKPQAYILFPIIILAIILRWEWSKWREIIKYLGCMLIPVLLIAGWQEIPKFLGGGNPYAISTNSYTGWGNFQIFLRGYLNTHLTEMPVWYWGVFKWFGLVLPRPWWWIATRLLLLAGIGVLIHFYQDFKKRVFSVESRIMLWIIGANLIYVLALLWFDWQFYQMLGRSLGLQARYYMPLLISQMLILLYGLMNLAKNRIVQEYIRRIVVVFFFTMFLAGIYVQLSGYYDFTSITTFIDQISQYKPFYAKGNWWYLWFSTYILGIIALVKRIIISEKTK